MWSSIGAVGDAECLSDVESSFDDTVQELDHDGFRDKVSMDHEEGHGPVGILVVSEGG